MNTEQNREIPVDEEEPVRFERMTRFDRIVLTLCGFTVFTVIAQVVRAAFTFH